MAVKQMYEIKFIKIYFKDAKQQYESLLKKSSLRIFEMLPKKYKNTSLVRLVIESAEYNFPGIRINIVFARKSVLLSVNALLFPDIAI